MKLLDVKYIIRQLLRKKYYTLLNLLGLGVGLGCAMLMAVYLIHEFSFDKFHTNAPELYRVIDGKNCKTPYAMGNAFKKEVPGIKNVLHIYSFDEVTVLQKEEPFTEKNMILADSSILSTLDFEIISGNKNQLLSQKNEIIISEKLARKYFSNESPVGKFIRIRLMSRDIDYIVTGVFKDLPSYSSLQTGLIANIHYAFDLLWDIEFSLGFAKEKANIDYEHDWKKDEFSTFIQLNPNANVEEISQKCSQISMQHQDENHKESIYLQPFTKMYLYSGEFNHNDTFKVNQLSSLKIFMAIGLLILFVACINFILISNADTGKSAVEIACRKVNGASRLQIVYIALLKTCLVAIISLIPALVFVNTALPVFNNLFQKELDIELLLKWQYLLTILSITLITGIAAGIYLGIYVSSISPARLIQNKGAGI